MDPTSARLAYLRLTPSRAGDLHAIAIDPHVRRYLLDGAIVDRAWAAAEVERSDALFAARGVGLWMLERDGVPIGFAGFRIFEEHAPAPQLLYAILAAHTGAGLATEAARACIASARAAGFAEILAAADAPNVRSIALLERLGFDREGAWAGAFGPTFRFVLR